MKKIFIALMLLVSIQSLGYQCETSAYNRDPYDRKMLPGSKETINVNSWQACYQRAIERAHSRPTAYDDGLPVLLNYVWRYNDSYVWDSSGAVSSLTDRLYKEPATGNRYVSEFDLFQASEKDDFN